MSLDIHKGPRTENRYSPLFSPISTHSSHNVPPTLSLFNPKRTLSSSYLNRNTASGAYFVPQRAISLEGYGLQKAKSETKGRKSIIRDIADSLVESGRSVWHKFIKSSEQPSKDQDEFPQNLEKGIKRRHRNLSDYYLIPRKFRRISNVNEENSQICSEERIVESNGRRLGTMTFSKDPFKWNDWKVDAIKTKNEDLRNSASIYPNYGTSFTRKKKLAKLGNGKSSNTLTLRNQCAELAYLRMIFNGEYKVPKMIRDERENQLKILQNERSDNIKMKKHIVDLTERIRNIILERSNEKKDAQTDELVILKEQKISSLERKRKDYRTRRQKLDQSKLDMEGEFKMYRRLLDERKHIQEEVRKKKESSKKEKLVPNVSERELGQIEQSLRRKDNAVLTNKDNIEVTIRDFKTLAPRRWLNDTVIEFFMHFIEKKTPRTVAFSSYFYTNLSERGYQGVRRWMRRKKAQIEQLDKIFVPVNLNESHWALGMIDMPSRTIIYVDSLSNGPNAVSFAILSDLQNYVAEESKNTMGTDFTLKTVRCPQQPNGFDCGIYLCLNTLYLSEEVPLVFDHNEAVRMRQYIAHLILLQGSK